MNYQLLYNFESDRVQLFHLLLHHHHIRTWIETLPQKVKWSVFYSSFSFIELVYFYNSKPACFRKELTEKQNCQMDFLLQCSPPQMRCRLPERRRISVLNFRKEGDRSALSICSHWEVHHQCGRWKEAESSKNCLLQPALACRSIRKHPGDYSFSRYIWLFAILMTPRFTPGDKESV